MLDCKICKIHSQFQAQANFSFKYWIVRPSDSEKSCPGYHYIEAKGHLKDYAEVSKEAWIEYGEIIHILTGIIHSKFSPLKIYTVSISEAVPHLHFHFVPRYISSPVGMDYLNLALKGGLPPL